MLTCTNTFLTDALGTAAKPCPRLLKLNETEQAEGKVRVAEVFDRLDAVSQGKETLQAMVFEPADKKLHLKLTDGKESATKAKAVVIEPFK